MRGHLVNADCGQVKSGARVGRSNRQELIKELTARVRLSRRTVFQSSQDARVIREQEEEPWLRDACFSCGLALTKGELCPTESVGSDFCFGSSRQF